MYPECGFEKPSFSHFGLSRMQKNTRMPRLRHVCVALISLSIALDCSILDRVRAESSEQAVSSSSEQAVSAENPADGRLSYQRHVRPVLQANCHGCHQPAKPEGGYVMTKFDRLVSGGESEEKPIVAGKPEESYLIELITPVDGEAEMPRDRKPLTEAERTLIAEWIRQGAHDDSSRPVATFDPEHPPRFHQLPAITSLDYSPQGDSLAVAGFHEVTVHTSDGASRKARLIGMSSRIESVRFSPDGKKLSVTGGSPAESGEVQIWDMKSFELLLSRSISYDTIRGTSWSPDGKQLAFGCTDNSVRGIDVETGEITFRLAVNNDWILGTVFSTDGRHLASVSRDKTAKLLDVRSERLVDNITSIADRALQGGIHCVERHPLRDEILLGGADGIPKIYRMFRAAKRQRDGDENLLWKLPQVPGTVFAIDMSHDGTMIAVGSSSDNGGALHLFGMDENPQIPDEITRILNRPPSVRTSEQSQRLVKYFQQGVETISKTTFADSSVFAVAIHPDGNHIAIGGGDGMVRLVDALSGQIEQQFSPVELDVDRVEVTNSELGRSVESRGEAMFSEVNIRAKAPVVGLAASPSRIQLTSSTDYVQLVVSAELASGDLVDATRLCHIEVEPALLSVSSTGVVRPHGDGTAEIKLSLDNQTLTIPVQISDFNATLEPDFQRDVSPVISKLGCNTGKCHGARDGKNGFKLSLRGYDALSDVNALTVELAGRRVDRAAPAASLMLRKPTAQVPHEGGQVLQSASDYYRILHAWIDSGARFNSQTQKVSQLDVYPKNPVVQQVGMRQQLRVVATYGDGYQRDVTSEAFVESGDVKIAKTMDGRPALVEVMRRGEASILVRYQGAYAATTITVMGDREGFVWQPQPVNNPIDDYVWKKLKRTKTLPSPLCDDYQFVRRVHLDLTGLPPTTEQIREFIGAPGEPQTKRDMLIDQLVGSPEYVEHRSNKWADLLQVNGKFLAREGATKFRQWIRNEVDSNTPYDEFVRKLLTASGSNNDNPAASYYKILREPQKLMANTMHLFMATRFTCNECHDHPFERWTQDDFYQMSAWFAQVKLEKDDAGGKKRIRISGLDPSHPLYEKVVDTSEGDVIHLRTSQIAQPAFPIECNYDVPDGATRRQRMASWITSPDNPYFARSFANRIWGYFMGRGLIEPLDDIRAGNPPSHPELLEFLTQEFIESDFNVQHLVRLICKSRVYQLSSQTNAWNHDDEINYSHAIPRRLTAEVLYDSIYRATGAQSEFPDVPKGTRAAALPDVGIKLSDSFLINMGRPARESSCECERDDEIQLGVVLALINSPTVNVAIGDEDNEITALARSVGSDTDLVNTMFLRVLNRPANDDELKAGLQVFEAIEQGHRRLEDQIRSLEQETRSDYERAEQKRAAELADVERELVEHQKRQEVIREQQEQQRAGLLAEARTALREYQDQTHENLRLWGEAHRDATSWTVLEPIELIADFERTAFSLDPDQTIFVKAEYGGGEFGKGAYRMSARTGLRKITGLRLEALSDDRLPDRGPGSNAGNFVLTELELQRANADISDAPILADWQFEQDPGSWTPMSNNKLSVADGRLTVKSRGAYPAMATQFRAEAGDFLLEVVAKIESQAMMRVYWSTLDKTDFDKSRSERHGVRAGNEEWRRCGFHFKTEQPLTGIRLDLNKKDGEVSVESIRLLRYAPRFETVAWEKAQANGSREEFDIGLAIDGTISDDRGWSIAEVGQDHFAIFTAKEPTVLNEDSLVRVRLHQNFGDGSHTLGKFRVSLTDSPQPLTRGIPSRIAKLLAIAPERRSPDQQDELAKYHEEHDEKLEQLQQAVTEAEKPLAEDPQLANYQRRIEQLRRPSPVDPELAKLQKKLTISERQRQAKRVTAAQDLAWALINTPEFLYNH